MYGIVLAGWASNNKYALLGGLRASAQMVSYEIAMGMSTVCVLLLAGNVSLNEIIIQQATIGWNIWVLSIAAFLFLVAAFAETNRLPFDMPEAESELISGYHTEYSAMKFSMFFIAEYAHLVTSSALMATLFLGGWDIPFWSGDDAFWYQGMLIAGFDALGAPVAASPAWWKTLLTLMSFSVKTLFFVVVYIWIRWTVPRFRYDQVMSLGWKVMLPISLAYTLLIGATILVLDQLGVAYGFFFGLVLTGVMAVLLACSWASFVFVLDRGRIIKGRG